MVLNDNPLHVPQIDPHATLIVGGISHEGKSPFHFRPGCFALRPNFRVTTCIELLAPSWLGCRRQLLVFRGRGEGFSGCELGWMGVCQERTTPHSMRLIVVCAHMMCNCVVV